MSDRKPSILSWLLLLLTKTGKKTHLFGRVQSRAVRGVDHSVIQSQVGRIQREQRHVSCFNVGANRSNRDG